MDTVAARRWIVRVLVAGCMLVSERDAVAGVVEREDVLGDVFGFQGQPTDCPATAFMISPAWSVPSAWIRRF